MRIACPNMSDIKLTYFNLRGRGELARLVLAYGNIKYEDVRVTVPWVDPKPWIDMKPSVLYNQLPNLSWNGHIIAQSIGIARFLAKKVGISGRDDLEAAQVDEVVYALQDALAFGWDAMFEEDEPRKLKMLDKYRAEVVPSILSHLESRLVGRGGQFLVGNAFSLADLQLFFFCSELELSWLQKVDDKKFPSLVGLAARVGNLPNIKHWIETRPKTTGPNDISL